jgi:ABC-type branched-subunit amino acid transport system ATPase component
MLLVDEKDTIVRALQNGCAFQLVEHDMGYVMADAEQSCSLADGETQPWHLPVLSS